MLISKRLLTIPVAGLLLSLGVNAMQAGQYAGQDQRGCIQELTLDFPKVTKDQGWDISVSHKAFVLVRGDNHVRVNLRDILDFDLGQSGQQAAHHDDTPPRSKMPCMVDKGALQAQWSYDETKDEPYLTKVEHDKHANAVITGTAQYGRLLKIDAQHRGGDKVLDLSQGCYTMSLDELRSATNVDSRAFEQFEVRQTLESLRGAIDKALSEAWCQKSNGEEDYCDNALGNPKKVEINLCLDQSQQTQVGSDVQAGQSAQSGVSPREQKSGHSKDKHRSKTTK
jgi:hypothetical protein